MLDAVSVATRHRAPRRRGADAPGPRISALTIVAVEATPPMTCAKSDVGRASYPQRWSTRVSDLALALVCGFTRDPGLRDATEAVERT